MEFLTTLSRDVQLLLVGAALSLLAALLSGTKKGEHRYIVVFALCVAVGGWRYTKTLPEPTVSFTAPTPVATTPVRTPAPLTSTAAVAPPKR